MSAQRFDPDMMTPRRADLRARESYGRGDAPDAFSL
jgi:hypothetical protein